MVTKIVSKNFDIPNSHSDGSGRPYKVKCRPPCFYSLAAYSKIVEGGLIADAVITMASLNFIAGEFDR